MKNLEKIIEDYKISSSQSEKEIALKDERIILLKKELEKGFEELK